MRRTDGASWQVPVAKRRESAPIQRQLRLRGGSMRSVAGRMGGLRVMRFIALFGRLLFV